MMSFSFSQGSFFFLSSLVSFQAPGIYIMMSLELDRQGGEGWFVCCGGDGDCGGGIPPFGILHDCFLGDERCYGILATRDDRAFSYGIGW